MDKILLHCCCAPCSAAIVEWMLQHGLRPALHYYNPNIFPEAEYLKRKEYILVKHVDEKYFDCDDWVQRVNDDFRVLKPMHDFLDYVYDE